MTRSSFGAEKFFEWFSFNNGILRELNRNHRKMMSKNVGEVSVRLITHLEISKHHEIPLVTQPWTIETPRLWLDHDVACNCHVSDDHHCHVSHIRTQVQFHKNNDWSSMVMVIARNACRKCCTRKGTDFIFSLISKHNRGKMRRENGKSVEQPMETIQS